MKEVDEKVIDFALIGLLYDTVSRFYEIRRFEHFGLTVVLTLKKISIKMEKNNNE